MGGTPSSTKPLDYQHLFATDDLVLAAYLRAGHHLAYVGLAPQPDNPSRFKFLFADPEKNAHNLSSNYARKRAFVNLRRYRAAIQQFKDEMKQAYEKQRRGRQLLMFAELEELKNGGR